MTGPSFPSGAEVVDDPGEAWARPSRPGSLESTATRSSSMRIFPAPPRIRFAGSPQPGSRSSRRRTGRRTRSHCPTPASSHRSTGLEAQSGFVRTRPFATRADPRARGRCRRGRRSRGTGSASRPSHSRASRRSGVKVVLLSGGGGGARFARGLQDVLEPGELTVIGNVGDDIDILGLHVSPDLDSLLYTLAGLIDRSEAGGALARRWNALESVGGWGGEDWFRLGDLDLGLHLVRTQALARRRAVVRDHGATRRPRRPPDQDSPGDGRSAANAGRHAGRHVRVSGVVRRARSSRRGRRCRVRRCRFGNSRAGSARGARQRPMRSSLLPATPISPSGRSSPSKRSGEAIERRRVRCVAVSPLVGGAAVTGPAGRMLSRMAGGTTPRHVTGCYSGLIDGLVIDESDAPCRSTPSSSSWRRP